MTKSFQISDLVDWRILQARRDVARAERRAADAERKVAIAEQASAAAALAARRHLEQERERSVLLRAELAEVYASTSWRVSHPVRVASRMLQALHQRGAPPPPLPPLPAAEAAPQPVAVAPLPPREHAILLRLQAGRD